MLKYLYRWYCHVEQRIGNIYQDSQTHRLISGFQERMRVCFRFSFLGKISDIKQVGNTAMLENSKTTQYLISFYRKQRDKIIYFLSASKTASLTKETREEFHLSPLKMAGIIVGTAVMINVFLSLVLQRPIPLWGYLMRGLFLFVAASGIFCKADWLTVKSNSIIIRKIGMK